jgi:hypothetical protein
MHWELPIAEPLNTQIRMRCAGGPSGPPAAGGPAYAAAVSARSRPYTPAQRTAIRSQA